MLTWFLGKMSANSFLYRFTGWRDRDLSPGQHTHMLPHMGRTFLDIKPILKRERERWMTWMLKTHFISTQNPFAIHYSKLQIPNLKKAKLRLSSGQKFHTNHSAKAQIPDLKKAKHKPSYELKFHCYHSVQKCKYPTWKNVKLGPSSGLKFPTVITLWKSFSVGNSHASVLCYLRGRKWTMCVGSHCEGLQPDLN